MINGQEAELTIIDIPYVEMSVSLKKNLRFPYVGGEGNGRGKFLLTMPYATKQYKTKLHNII